MMFSESAGTGRPSYPNYAPLGDREGEAPAEPHGARICWGDGSPGGSPSQFFHTSPFKGGIKFSSLVAPPSAPWATPMNFVKWSKVLCSGELNANMKAIFVSWGVVTCLTNPSGWSGLHGSVRSVAVRVPRLRRIQQRWSIIVKSKAPKSKRFFKTGLSKPLKRLLPKKQRP